MLTAPTAHWVKCGKPIILSIKKTHERKCNLEKVVKMKVVKHFSAFYGYQANNF